MNFFSRRIANVAGVCDLIMDDDFDTPVEAVAALVQYLLGYDEDPEDEQCIDVDFVEENPQIDPAVESREKTLRIVDAIITRISLKFVGTPVFGMLLGLLKVGRR